MVYYCIFWSGQLLVNSPGTEFLRVLYPSSVSERKISSSLAYLIHLAIGSLKLNLFQIIMQI